MGCLLTKKKNYNVYKKKMEIIPDIQQKYSWDNRSKIDPEKFTIAGLENDVCGRIPNQINGQQFVIKDCKNSMIYLLDHINTITIDDCENCKIFIGPVRTSVFIRDCNECQLMVACQQFRARDCHRVDVFIACVSQPVIEASSKIRFGPYTYFYPQLEDQFRAAGLSPFNSIWSDIYDFTPVDGESPNFSLLPSTVECSIPPPSGHPRLGTAASNQGDGPGPDWTAAQQQQLALLSCVEVSTSREDSLVPWTHFCGREVLVEEGNWEACLVFVFYDRRQHERARKIIQVMAADYAECLLVSTREVTMTPAEAETIISSEHYSMHVIQGPVVALEFRGPDVIEKSVVSLSPLTCGTTGLLYITRNRETALDQITKFQAFINMRMNTN